MPYKKTVYFKIKSWSHQVPFQEYQNVFMHIAAQPEVGITQIIGLKSHIKEIKTRNHYYKKYYK